MRTPLWTARNRLTLSVALGALAVLSLVTTSALGGGAGSGSASTQRSGGKATILMPAGDPDHLDPQLWYTLVSWNIGFQICTTLVTLPDKGGEAGKVVVGGLADMPKVSNGGRTYAFKLRPGIRFSNGKPITPADIKWTFVRMLTPSLASPGAGFFGDILGADKVIAGKSTSLPGIVTSGNTVTFKLAKPSGSFLYRITMRFTCPVPNGTPPKAIENGSLPSSGPYMIKKYTPNRDLDLVKNPNYNAASLGKRGLLDEIDLPIGVDPQQASLKIRSGSADLWLDKLPPADATQALHDPTLKGRVFSNPYAAVEYLWLNNDVAPFDNVKVRQAVNYAVDRLQMLRVWGGPSQGATTDQILPPTMPLWHDYHAYPNSPDLAKAKALMKASGVKTPVTVVVRVRNDAPGFRELAQVLQQDLQPIGINVDIKSAADSVNNSIIDNRKNHIAAGINEWSQDYPDPEDFVNVLLDPRRPDFPQARSRFAAADAIPIFNHLDTLTGTARLRAYQAADEAIMRRWAPWAPLINPIEVDIISSRITGFVYQPVYGPDLAVLSLK
jgi:peptide/nickel transport system substrate-binding protein